MEHKEDIGKYIEDNMEKKHEAPSDELWNRIDSSLNKGEKRKNGFLRLTLVSVLLLSTMAVYYYVDSGSNGDATNASEEIVDSETETDSGRDSEEETFLPIINNQKIDTDVIASEADSKKINADRLLKDSKKKRASTRQKASQKKLVKMDSVVTITRYSYSSSDNTTFEASGKKFIDSIIQENTEEIKQIKDSTPSHDNIILLVTKEKDSLID